MALSCFFLQAKGYPDLSTRQLLKKIHIKYPTLQFFALVDADPHGISIYLVYKFGSLVSDNMSRQNERQCSCLLLCRSGDVAFYSMYCTPYCMCFKIFRS